jgi:hypothetical protein
MKKLISVTENGSKKKVSIMIDKILRVEPLTYNSGETVTIISYINDTAIHVSEDYNTVIDLINKS